MDSDVIDHLMQRNELRQLESRRPSEASERIRAANIHLESAEILRKNDLNDSFKLIYDAARKIAEGALLTIGLRASSTGGDDALARAITAIFEEDFRDFDWIRRRRNEMRYSSLRRGGVREPELDDAMRSTLTMRSRLQTLINGEPVIDQSISGRRDNRQL
ncbi:hypothetical protein [Umezawaea sp. Da 62-37]|uniref:hypothetical protein n=1 Tax=Umezawaea sp. Da 62-37 TaxID=3075927 RepID=UPI0028F6DAD0|nr:hypothetical protein [Umezawaea sp. Da 62-37]WNV82891.1 hypothetical protein RM788_32455 [Umezawaea sp. Da 62-37]